MKKPISPFFFTLIFLIVIIRITPIQANPSVDITVKTDKQEYYCKDAVKIYGNLTLDGVLVTDGLVGIEVKTPQDKSTLVIRTVTTGRPPSQTPYIFLEYVVPCDADGNPKFSFRKGTLAYFKMSIVNLDIEPHNATMTVNTYYSDNTPFGNAAIEGKFSAESNPTFKISVPIPTNAVLGTAIVYANAFTDWPKLGGTPYCNEVNATFQITDSGGSSQTTQEFTTLQTNETGNFNCTFMLPRRTPIGNYTAYVTSRYLGESVFNSTTFEVFILGDLGGGVPPQFFAFDGIVDSKDYSLFLLCFKGEAPEEAMYLGDLGGGVPPQFFAFDGIVDSKDYSLFLLCFKGLGP